RYISVGGDQDEGHIRCCLLCLVQKIQPRKTRHAQVRKDDTRKIGAQRSQRGGGGVEIQYLESGQFQCFHGGQPQVGVIFDQHYLCMLTHFSSCQRFRRSRTTAPPCACCSISRCPPMSCMTLKAIDRPRPSPFPGSLVVTKGSVSACPL